MTTLSEDQGYFRFITLNERLNVTRRGGQVDFAVDRTGGIDPKHAAAYRAFGAWTRACYGRPVAAGALPPGATAVELPLDAPVDRVPPSFTFPC